MTYAFFAILVLGVFYLWHGQPGTALIAFAMAWFGPVAVSAMTNGFEQAIPEMLFRLFLTALAIAVCVVFDKSMTGK